MPGRLPLEPVCQGIAGNRLRRKAMGGWVDAAGVSDTDGRRIPQSFSGVSDQANQTRRLSPERVLDQIEEIDKLNKKLAPFVILKGIESDILNDGSLDYDKDILSQFDMVVASVHSNLRMDIDKATSRLIRAVEKHLVSRALASLQHLADVMAVERSVGGQFRAGQRAERRQ